MRVASQHGGDGQVARMIEMGFSAREATRAVAAVQKHSGSVTGPTVEEAVEVHRLPPPRSLSVPIQACLCSGGLYCVETGLDGRRDVAVLRVTADIYWLPPICSGTTASMATTTMTGWARVLARL